VNCGLRAEGATGDCSMRVNSPGSLAAMGSTELEGAAARLRGGSAAGDGELAVGTLANRRVNSPGAAGVGAAGAGAACAGEAVGFVRKLANKRVNSMGSAALGDAAAGATFAT
jgi:hypothetical protein